MVVKAYPSGMSTVTEVIENALALPLTDRSYVASKLIESLEQDTLSPEQLAEYDARFERWQSGETKASSREEVDAKIEAILNR